jgi:light-regulated signal transduction histidine kinase (bacteriophytochrome)
VIPWRCRFPVSSRTLGKGSLARRTKTDDRHKPRAEADARIARDALAICSQIVKAHGGTLTLESVLGEGSTFRVELPFASSDESPA